MVRGRKPKSPSPGYRRRTPLVLRWFIGLAGATALLVALAYLVGSRADRPRNEGERILDGVSSPGIALAIAFGALVFAAWCLRHMLLHRLAWRPGRIEVARFTDGSKLTDATRRTSRLLPAPARPPPTAGATGRGAVAHHVAPSPGVGEVRAGARDGDRVGRTASCRTAASPPGRRRRPRPEISRRRAGRASSCRRR